MPYIEVDPGVNLAYQDRGSGEPVIFVHGWGGSGDVWDYQVLDLAPSYRCITVDLRGHGPRTSRGATTTTTCSSETSTPSLPGSISQTSPSSAGRWAGTSA
nr:alpha/beta hydrolase [Rhodococcus sp. WB9]